MRHPPKYPRTLHWPLSESVQPDDKIHPTPASFVGHEVVITEKLDGGNTCLWQGEVFARSTSLPSNAGWMGMVRKHHAWKTINSAAGMVFYGEDIFGVHSIEYDAVPECETFRLFATRFVPQSNQGGCDVFQDWDTVERFAKEIDVPIVPVVFRGTFTSVDEITSWFRDHINTPSVLGGPKEGFVMRWAAGFPATEFSQKVAKYVRPNHVQTDQHWKQNWQPCKLR